MKFCLCLAALIAVIGSPVFLSHNSNDSQFEQNVVDVVRSKRFELVDDKRRVRIEMSMEDDNPVLKMKDENGNDRVVVFHQADATGVYIKDNEKHTRIGLAQFAHGGGVAMHGEGGKGSAVYVLMNGQARLDVYNNDGKLTDYWPQESKNGADVNKLKIADLAQHWIHAREEETDGVMIFRPKTFKEFPPSRFRMQYVLDADGGCRWLYLSPTDAHHLREGKWRLDDKLKNVIHIEQGGNTVSYEIIELKKDLLRAKRLHN